MFYIFTPNRPGDKGRNERSPRAAPSTYEPAAKTWEYREEWWTSSENWLVKDGSKLEW